MTVERVPIISMFTTFKGNSGEGNVVFKPRVRFSMALKDEAGIESLLYRFDLPIPISSRITVHSFS